jgi:hypothetical protein
MESVPKSSSTTPPKTGQQVVAQATPEAYWSLTPEQLLSPHCMHPGMVSSLQTLSNV